MTTGNHEEKGDNSVRMTIIRQHREKADLSFRMLESKTGIAVSRLHRMEHRRECVWKRDVERLRAAIPTLENEIIADNDRLARFVEEDE